MEKDIRTSQASGTDVVSQFREMSIDGQKQNRDQTTEMSIDGQHRDQATEAKRFIKNYYRAFDANRAVAELMKLFREDAVMEFNGKRFHGKEAIVAKLTSLRCRHRISRMYHLPPYVKDSVHQIVTVGGHLWLDGKPHAHNLWQMFELFPAPEGSYCVKQLCWAYMPDQILVNLVTPLPTHSPSHPHPVDVDSYIRRFCLSFSVSSSPGDKKILQGVNISIDREKRCLTTEAKRFMEDYYRTFDANMADLVNLFLKDSSMRFECEVLQGKEAILAKLTSLQCQQQISHMYRYRRGVIGNVFERVVVSGYMWLDGKQTFFQTFDLVPKPEGSFYIKHLTWFVFHNEFLATLMRLDETSSASTITNAVMGD